MPLMSGKECIILEGFGDKICKQIDEYLRKFLNEGGILHPETNLNIIDEESDKEKHDSCSVQLVKVFLIIHVKQVEIFQANR